MWWATAIPARLRSPPACCSPPAPPTACCAWMKATPSPISTRRRSSAKSPSPPPSPWRSGRRPRSISSILPATTSSSTTRALPWWPPMPPWCVVDGVAGVEVQTEKVWGFADDFKLPRAVVINKLDRERADFERALESVQADFRPHRRAHPDAHRRGARFQRRGRPGPHEGLHLHARWRRQRQGGRDSRRPGRCRPEGPRSPGRDGGRRQRRPDGRVLRQGHAAAPNTSSRACNRAVREMRIFPVLCASGLHNIGIRPDPEFHRGQPSRAHRARKPSRPKSTATKRTQKIAEQRVRLRHLFSRPPPIRSAGRITYFKVYSGVVKNDANL